MSPRRGRMGAIRLSRFEPVEARIFLSGQSPADFHLDYFVEAAPDGVLTPSLVDIDELTGLSQVRAEYGFTGGGQTVAVIDSGIAYTHQALGGGFGSEYRVVGGYDFTAERDADPYDDGPQGSHGTHVAGIIAGSDERALGVAPGVDLVSLRVFDDDGVGHFNWVEDALQWVHANRFAFENPITTVNLSLGANWDTVPDWVSLEDDFARLKADGIFIAVAGGNDFAAMNEIGLSYPASSPLVVPVASVDADGSLSYFSQRSPQVIAAPGRSILSTVPDYAGNGNGVDDDFARYSGTSMAAPYVAGASVLLREAYEFVGINDVNQDTLYNLMVNTADTIHDPITGLDYHRLNLDRAIDSLMPADDFGSTRATAHNLGTIVDAYTLSGAIGGLDDVDWFRFTAGITGSVTMGIEATGSLSPRWEVVGAGSVDRSPGGESVSFDVIAGQSYAFGLSTGDGLGKYSLDLEVQGGTSRSTWGVIDQQQFDGYRIDADGQRFAFAAAADGTLTVEAFFSHTDGDVDLRLYDARQQLVGSSYATGDYERIDVTATAGASFYLEAYVYGSGVNDGVDFQVTNLVSQAGDRLVVRGTQGDDAFTFRAGARPTLAINGVEYAFAAQAARSVTFDGRGGSDSALLAGTAGNDVGTLYVGAARLSGTGYEVAAWGVETATLRAGGGYDRVVFYDSPGNDTFTATPSRAEMTGDGFVNAAAGFDRVDAYATAGGIDVAKLWDSPGNDQFAAGPAGAALYGEGFYNQVYAFDGVHAYAINGGIDVAKLWDSPGNDRFVADPTQGALFGDGFYNRAKHFEGVHAYAVSGGFDTAVLYDSAGNDRFVDDSISAALWSDGYYNRAKYFEQVDARSEAGGIDRAFFYDSRADEFFQAASDWASIAGNRRVAGTYGFEYVQATAQQGGSNRAEVRAVDFLLELDGDWAC